MFSMGPYDYHVYPIIHVPISPISPTLTTPHILPYPPPISPTLTTPHILPYPPPTSPFIFPQ
ncbi:hypothetical protein NBO_6g0053 [Nosema bombycis CQ1]|uniref:Uncharacterized protein n=1 Tax=Nosema bombycis (strain CQ1 / CVCC 102059) TaxID=578461 RepID=R0KWP0_NOSB1|nr:hypothetical protein NBO_6g0053 [Nosema bombycis CQ1]|eukprot:EOB15301.1 hypothetical protein NBO_6g0053 [Nosema bombycis CQ1]